MLVLCRMTARSSASRVRRRTRDALALGLALALASPWAEAAPPATEEPPTGSGLITSGSVVLGIGGAAVLGGSVMLIVFAGSREGYGSAIGVYTILAGLVVSAVGVGLLVPGLSRRGKHRTWEAENMARLGDPTMSLTLRGAPGPEAALGGVWLGEGLRLSPSATGFVLQF